MVSSVDSSDSSYYFELLAQQTEEEETLADALASADETSSTSSTSSSEEDSSVMAANSQNISDFLEKDEAGEVDQDYIDSLIEDAESTGLSAQGAIFDVMA